MNTIIEPSHLSNKKYNAVIENKKTVPFGQKGASDLTIHKDPERKERYINRHKKNERWNDPKTAGFYAKHILWNKPSLKQSVDDLNKRFKNINFSLK